MAQKLIVEIVGDTSSLERAFQRAGIQSQTFGGKLGGVGKAAAFAAGSAGFAALTIAARNGVTEWLQHQKVAAQTAAVLKSTGGQAGVTAKHVGDLANKIMGYSGIDDEAIQSTENLVLGFTNIRNAAGKHNDIFDRTVQLVTDYSVRTGKDAKTGTVLFGKALNDLAEGKIPTTIRGVGSLSDATRKEIAAHLKAGDVVGAQAILLKTLETRYQGAAAAAGQRLPGQLEILKQKFNNLAGEGVAVVIKELQDLAPVFTAIGDVIRTLLPIITPIAKYLFDNIVVPFKVIADLIHGDWAKAWADLKKPVEDAIKAVGAVLEALKPVWDAMKSAAESVWNALKSSLETIWRGMQTTASAVFSALKTTVDTVWNGIKLSLTTIWGGLRTAASTAWMGIKMAITVPFDAAKAAVTAAANAIRSTVVGVFSAARGAVSAEWNAIRNAITGAINAAKNVVVSAASAIKRAINDAFKVFGQFGGKVKDLILSPINWAIGKINSIHIPGFSIHIPGVSVAGVTVIPDINVTPFSGLDPFHIPKLATGGIVTAPTLALIGERGPEAVVPLRGGPGGGGVTIQNLNVQVRAETDDPDGLAKKIAKPVVREIQKYARGNSLPGLLGT